MSVREQRNRSWTWRGDHATREDKRSCRRARRLLCVVVGLSGLALVSGCHSARSAAPVERLYTTHDNGSAADAAPSPAPAPVVDTPTLDETSALEEYLAYAALNNAGLEAAFDRWKAAVERVVQVGTLPDPRFNYRYFIREVETRVGPQKQAFGLSQVFPWFGKLELRADAAAAAAKAQRQQFEVKKLAVFYEVKDAYYEYYFLGRAIAVVQENVDLVEYLESVARARYKTAAASHPDVIRAQVELGKLEDRLLALRDLRGPMVARLNAALNRSPHENLPFPTTVADEQLAADDSVVLALMVNSNPELRALASLVDKAAVEIELAKKEYFPDFTLGFDYTDVGQPPRANPQGFANPAALRSGSRIVGGMGDLIDAYAIGRSFRSGDRPNDAGQDVWMVSLSMNLPIWHGKYAAGEREARARERAARNTRRQRENDIAAKLQRTLYEYRDAERKIVLYRETLIPKAKESIGSTETAFRAGNATFLDLVDAERSLLDFELSYERALANRGSRLAELDRLVGTTLPRLQKTNDEAGRAPAGSDAAGD